MKPDRMAARIPEPIPLQLRNRVPGKMCDPMLDRIPARVAAIGLLALGLLLFFAPERIFSAGEAPGFRLGVTASLFSDANENDVRAAMKAWILTVAREGNLTVETDLKIFRNLDELRQFGRRNPVQGYGLILPEYEILRREIEFDVAILGVSEGRIEEEYLLLVHRDAGVDELEGLRGGSLRILESPRMSLATIWLDARLLEAGLPPSATFFGRMERNARVSMTALPVFFRKADACLVTRAGFEVMAELNPQLETSIRILAHSPPVIPAGFMVRKDFRSPHRGKILNTMVNLSQSTGGRQILALIQMDGVEVHPVSRLDESVDLIRKHRRLSGAAAGDFGEGAK